MKTISIINLKGGVGKTITAINLAYNFAALRNQRVLLVDNDKQGNTSRFFGMYDESKPSISELLTDPGAEAREIVQNTAYSGLDVLPANMGLVAANMRVLQDTSDWSQVKRLNNALHMVQASYDYCFVDCAPDINMSTINALVASDYVLIPVKMDKFAFDGLDVILGQIEYARQHNINLMLLGCFVTAYYKSAENESRELTFRKHEEYQLLDTHIRRTQKVDESTYAGKPLTLFSRRCGAAQDYIKLAEEVADSILPF